VAVGDSLGLGNVLAGRYRLVSLLGQGGAGAVYLAEDTQLFDRPVAVKELIEQFSGDGEREAAVARFTQEARMLVTLSHPNLPDVRSYFAEDGRHYLVMEYVEGTTLLDQLRRANGVLLPATVMEWGRQVCDVLTYLHSRTPPVVFRDLKPSNIMVDRYNRIKLIDFGTARHFDMSKHTDTLKMGSIGYAAPEQYQGQGQTSPQTDIYALGATLHHMLTNEDPSARPFVFTPPSMIRPEVPESLSRAVMRALNLDPAQRFPTALEMRHALEPDVAENTTAYLPVAASFGPNPWLVGLLGIVGAALLEGVALLPELSRYGKGLASGDWAVDYGVLVGAAIGAGLGGALAPGWQPHRIRGSVAALFGAAALSACTGLAVIVGIGHGDPRHFSLRLLAALALPAAAAGAALMRGFGVGE
jgi:tRNA A-37 threonylcarbamoyl transferase component Bud32